MSNTHFSLDPETDVSLCELLRDIIEKYFSGKISATIFWQVPPTNNFENCPPGGVEINTNRILIHPYLKKSFTPRFVVEYIIFHECLHIYLGYPDDGEVHCKKFLRHESKYQHREKAKVWLQKNLFPILSK